MIHELGKGAVKRKEKNKKKLHKYFHVYSDITRLRQVTFGATMTRRVQSGGGH